MIPEQTLLNYPLFGDNATKVEPDNNKKSNGWQQADVVPAEWMNWAWYHNSKGISDLNDGVKSMEKEIGSVLSFAGITPNVSSHDQLSKAIQKNNGVIMASTKTITNAPEIIAGCVIKILFTADITGSDTTTGLSISYNGTSFPVKACNNGTLEAIKAHEIITGTYKYIQAWRTLEMAFDGTQFIVLGNPIVMSGSDYTVFADGKVGCHKVGFLMPYYRDEEPYGWLKCDGRTISNMSTKYPGLYEFLNNRNTIPDIREATLKMIGLSPFTSRHVNATGLNVGEFIADRLQSHNHFLDYNDAGAGNYRGAAHLRDGASYNGYTTQGMDVTSGATTEVNAVGVNILIKAIEGI